MNARARPHASNAPALDTHLDVLGDRLRGRTPPGFWATHTRLEEEYDRLLP